MTPPAWRALADRARRLGLRLAHGPHSARLRSGPERTADDLMECVSWLGGKCDSIILRTAVAAALEQLERPTRRGRTR